jgi:pimeloyl-ACP methyl ester carboxylesterase
VLVLLAAGMLSMVRRDIPAEQLKARYATPPSKFVEIDGLSVHYRDQGQGFPIVLLHGAASSLFTWDAWAADLSKDYRVIRYDLPGFGLTGPNATKDYSMEWHVGFLEKFLDRLNVPACYLAGNSFGGHIAADFASAHPERVKKLILVDAGGYPNPHRGVLAMRLAQLPVIGEILGHATPRFFIAMTIRQMYGDPRRLSDAVIDRYYDFILRAGNRETFGIILRGAAEDPTAKFRAIEVPTLILWGSEDRTSPVLYAERFHRDIRHSQLIVYQGAGHVPMEEIPAETIRDTRAFLAAQ